VEKLFTDKARQSKTNNYSQQIRLTETRDWNRVQHCLQEA